jgi:MFS family permease
MAVRPTTRRAAKSVALPLIAAQLMVVLAGNTLPTPLFPAYRDAWGAGTGALTGVFAVTVVGVLITLVTAGRLSDAIGRRPVLAASLALSLAGSTIGLLAPDLGWLYAARVVHGLGAGLIAGAATAAMREVAATPGAAARATALASVGGLAAGLLLAGALAEHAPHTLQLSWIAHGALAALALATVALLPETVAERRLPRPRVPRLAVPAAAPGRFARLTGATAVAFSSVGLLAALAPTLLVDVLHGDDVLLGASIAILAYTVSGIAQVTSGDGPHVLARGQVLLALGLAALAAALQLRSIPVLALAAVVIGSGNGAIYVSALAEVNRLAAPDERAGTASTYFVGVYVAITVPVLLVGLLADGTSLRLATSAFAAVAIAALAVSRAGAPARSRSDARCR